MALTTFLFYTCASRVEEITILLCMSRLEKPFFDRSPRVQLVNFFTAKFIKKKIFFLQSNCLNMGKGLCWPARLGSNI